ncbi:hypothetical protein SAMN05660662_0652 [Blastococcus aurantiacus]|uniref:Uncharacterized protein n=1 Tax=Blastococcus aurantiacus TaxID=1550231 RepID=A0A1G7HJF6_9ACTN|nr:hypothetical protein [Blastococcus aurantiacus]SDF00483.1 hypothetical protein SAMN05660662_0652 [Blastococcus aurantiacus]
MAAFLLSVHVVAAVIFVGSVTVAVSLFPRYARLALDETTAATAVPGVQLLHRVTRAYAALALAVPVFGVAVAAQLDVLGDAWVQISMALTLLAGVLLAGVVLPGQRRLLDTVTAAPEGSADDGATVAAPARIAEAAALVRRLAMVSGVFNLVWVTVVVLMIVRPGSTTGV